MGAREVRWGCARCGVSVGRIDGARSCLPGTWTRSDGLAFCLSCSRARAADAAMDSVPDWTSHEDRMRLRRRALIAFEIGRTPTAPDRTIASACRTSSKMVAAVRNELTAGTPVPDCAVQRAA